METMTLHLETMDFHLNQTTKHLSVGGIIYVTLGEQCFPEDQWYDLVRVDLESWLPMLISFAQNHTDSCVLRFMDGPCRIKLHRSDSACAAAVCLWEQEVVIPETIIDFRAFLKSVAACARKFSRALYETCGVEMRELGELAKTAQALCAT